MNQSRKNCFKAARRAVIKVGSNVLTLDDGLNLKAIRSLSGQISRLIDDGLEVIFVSSGSMAAGLRKVGLSKRPDEIPKRQAISAIGQAGLIMEYEKAFKRYGKRVAQILLTGEDLTNRHRYLNARNTLTMLLEWGIVPIINENDTVMVEEIKFGDNDTLSAMIALQMDADVLINLTDIDGLYTTDPRTDPEAQLIPVVEKIGKGLQEIAGGIAGALGTGGMLSKITAAKKVMAAGVPMVIAGGETPRILERLFKGEACGTFFVPKRERLASRKRWIGYTVKPKGVLRLDAGAVSAILNRGKSLLPSGIVGVEGDFNAGAPVELCADGGEPLGIGLVNYSAADIRKIMGLRTNQISRQLGSKPYDEVIHRDHLAVTSDDRS